MSKTIIQKLELLYNLNQKELNDLVEECRHESYVYFDLNIRSLPKDEHQNFVITYKDFYDNDVDAFRHAYTSGVFTQVYFSTFANIVGLANEIFGSNKIEAQNMDLWNNSVGRKYGKKTDSREDLANYLKEALENGELIIDPSDTRVYKGLRHFNYDPLKPVQVIQESKTGLNEVFLDCSNGNIMTREDFLNQINLGNYPGYSIMNAHGKSIPISKADGTPANNLG